MSGSGAIDGAGSGGDTVVAPKASKKPGSSENGKVANAAPPSAGEVLDGLRGAASAVLSEHAAAAERVRTLGLDIAAREAAQLDATNADDFEAAEALERPLQRSRVELSESTGRMRDAAVAVEAYESELLEASAAALDELTGKAAKLLGTRDDTLERIHTMAAVAKASSLEGAEKATVEKERIAKDASRLEADRSELDEAKSDLEAEIERSASGDVALRDEWHAKQEEAAARVAELRKQLAAAEAEEEACVAKEAEYAAKVEAVRTGYSKQLKRLSLRTKALADKERGLQAARDDVSKDAAERRDARHAAAAERTRRASSLRELRAEYVGVRASRRERVREARYLRLLRDCRKARGEAEAEVAVAVAPLAAEVEAVGKRVDAATASSSTQASELTELRVSLEAAAARTPELTEAKRRAVEGRAFKEAGRIAAELKAIAADETSGRSRETELKGAVEASSIAVEVLTGARVEVETELTSMRKASDGRLAQQLRKQILRAERALDSEATPPSEAKATKGGEKAGEAAGVGGAEVQLLNAFASALRARVEELCGQKEADEEVEAVEEAAEAAATPLPEEDEGEEEEAEEARWEARLEEEAEEVEEAEEAGEEAKSMEAIDSAASATSPDSIASSASSPEKDAADEARSTVTVDGSDHSSMAAAFAKARAGAQRSAKPTEEKEEEAAAGVECGACEDPDEPEAEEAAASGEAAEAETAEEAEEEAAAEVAGDRAERIEALEALRRRAEELNSEIEAACGEEEFELADSLETELKAVKEKVNVMEVAEEAAADGA